MTLTDFLLARIAEDEAVARAATDDGIQANGQHAHWREGPRGDCGCCSRVVGLGVDVDDRQAPHVARHDPARVLAECEAKRRIVGLIGVADSPEVHVDAFVCAQLAARHLALPYADHPDYREAWRP